MRHATPQAAESAPRLQGLGPPSQRGPAGRPSGCGVVRSFCAWTSAEPTLHTFSAHPHWAVVKPRLTFVNDAVSTGNARDHRRSRRSPWRHPVNGFKQRVSERRLPTGESVISRFDGVEAANRCLRSEKCLCPRRRKVVVATGLNDRTWKRAQAGNAGVRLERPGPMRLCRVPVVSFICRATDLEVLAL